MQQAKTQAEMVATKVMKLELVVMLLLQVLRSAEPNNGVLAKAEKILSQGD
jgi:hypothetical protein